MTLYNVVGIDDLEGLTFARCTTLKNANKAMMLLEDEGYECMLRIEKDEIVVDEIVYGNEVIDLNEINL